MKFLIILLPLFITSFVTINFLKEDLGEKAISRMKRNISKCKERYPCLLFSLLNFLFLKLQI